MDILVIVVIDRHGHIVVVVLLLVLLLRLVFVAIVFWVGVVLHDFVAAEVLSISEDFFALEVVTLLEIVGEVVAQIAFEITRVIEVVGAVEIIAVKRVCLGHRSN